MLTKMQTALIVKLESISFWLTSRSGKGCKLPANQNNNVPGNCIPIGVHYLPPCWFPIFLSSRNLSHSKVTNRTENATRLITNAGTISAERKDPPLITGWIVR